MKRTLCIFILLLLLLGCTVPATSPVTASAPETEAPMEIVVLTPAPTGTPSPEPTETPTPEPTATPTPEPTATPLPFTALAIPEGMRARKGYTASQTTGVVRRDADGAFFCYGAMGETEPCFYPSDGQGTVAPGETPLDTVCIVPAYTPTETPKADGAKLLAVYIGSQSVAAFVAEDGEWIEQRIMICSTGRQKHDTPTGSFKISDRYTYKLLGTGDTHCYGLWACRFKPHYLFHSVPINYEAKKASQGHRMCDMHKFEKLGSPASDGCVRVCVGDAKWIYDFTENAAVKVWITKDSGPTPPQLPAVIWEEPYTDKNGFGWDPTDPDPDNPYLAPENDTPL